MFLASKGPVEQWLGGWLAWELLGKVVVGSLVGVAVGWSLAAVAFRSRARSLRLAEQGEALLAIAALVRAAAVFGRPDWLDAARRAFDTVATRMAAPDDGRLVHALRHGQVSAAGLLEDHAAMARAEP